MCSVFASKPLNALKSISYFACFVDPAAPTDLRILSRETSSMSFTWSPPANPGKIDSYNYSITVSGATTPEIERSVKIDEYSHQLSAGKTYIIEVRAITNNQRGLPASLTFTMSMCAHAFFYAVCCLMCFSVLV